ncbi:MAG: hypothetical protein IKG51_02700 [Firmicutes bacterium]|nr:hypothetical protein [Bacillota bacterium]
MKKRLLICLVCTALILTSCTSQTDLPRKPSQDKFAGGQYIEESSAESSSEPVQESSVPQESSVESSTESSTPPAESSAAAESSVPDESSAESSTEPVQESSAESSSEPVQESSVESSTEPVQESSSPAEESSAAAKDPSTYTIVDWLGTTEQEADYIIAQTIEDYLYDNDMEAVLNHMSNPSYYNSQTVAWFIDDTGEIYYSIPNFSNTAYLEIPSGVVVSGALFYISDYFDWSGRCVGPWAAANAETANFFRMTFSASGDFYLGYGWQYSEFFGFEQGTFSFNQDGTQISITLPDRGTSTFDLLVIYKHVILIQRSETGLMTGDPAGTIYTLTMTGPN